MLMQSSDINFVIDLKNKQHNTCYPVFSKFHSIPLVDYNTTCCKMLYRSKTKKNGIMNWRMYYYVEECFIDTSNTELLLSKQYISPLYLFFTLSLYQSLETF